MKARVKTGFRGCRDGSSRVETFVKGDVVEGDLARVAIDEKWATEVKPKRASAVANGGSAADEAANGTDGEDAAVG